MVVSLVLSVPDLQLARVLAAAEIPQIALVQNHPHFAEIKSWLEGTEVGAQIVDPDQPIPKADFLVIPFEYYDRLSFLEHKKYWLIKDNEIIPEGLIGLSKTCKPESSIRETGFIHARNANSMNKLWLDATEDDELLDALVLNKIT